VAAAGSELRTLAVVEEAIVVEDLAIGSATRFSKHLPLAIRSEDENAVTEYVGEVHVAGGVNR
jgi:hypothetical protein